MRSSREHTILQWIVLLLVGTSITFSTLHSHHDIEWNHTKSHVDADHCLVENTKMCPVCGYLFNAQTVELQSKPAPGTFTGYIACFSDTNWHDPKLDQPNGRSPPALI